MNSSPEQDFEAARRAARSGDHAGAEAAYRRVLDVLPDNVEALRFAARAALLRHEGGNSIVLLSRAARAEPNNAVVFAELGLAYRAAERFDAGKHVLERALSLSPDPATRLVLADLLDHDDRGELALLHFFRALIDAQRTRRWAGEIEVPDLDALIARANTRIRAGRKAWFDAALAPLSEVTPRIHDALAMHLGERPPHPDLAGQRVGFFFVPTLSTTPLLDAARYGWIATADFAAFGADIDAALSPAPATPLILRGIDQFEARPAPRLLNALHAAPLLNIWNHAPDAQLLRLPAQLAPPRSNWRCCAIVNAGTTPIDVVCGGATAVVAPHAAVICDASFGGAISGRNNAAARVLAFDVWHPRLAEAERAALSALVDAALDFDQRLEELT